MSRELLVIAALYFGFVLSLILFIFWVRRMRDVVPRYKKYLPDVEYQEETIKCLYDAYQAAGSIEGSLLLAARKSRQKKARKRFRAALSYLKDSRYRDYETALFAYASDNSKNCNNLFLHLIKLEAQKIHRLPMKKE